jgi:hypothetical protein
MPAVSKAQRKLFAIAEHHPEQVRPENRDVLKMNVSELARFASTSEKGLPAHVKRRPKGRR